MDMILWSAYDVASVALALMRLFLERALNFPRIMVIHWYSNITSDIA